jgi:hypothetical protein
VSNKELYLFEKIQHQSSLVPKRSSYAIFFFKATGFSVEIADGTTALNGALQVLSSLCGFALEIVGDQNLTLKISLEHF